MGSGFEKRLRDLDESEQAVVCVKPRPALEMQGRVLTDLAPGLEPGCDQRLALAFRIA